MEFNSFSLIVVVGAAAVPLVSSEILPINRFYYSHSIANVPIESVKTAKNLRIPIKGLKNKCVSWRGVDGSSWWGLLETDME